MMTKRILTQTIASRVPSKFFVARGSGQSDFGPGKNPWLTTCYDTALLQGGIANYNIMKYTSVMPRDAVKITRQEAEDQGLLRHGMVLETIMAQDNGKKGDYLCAGVGTFSVHKGDEHLGGFAVEYEGGGDRSQAEKILYRSMVGLFERRYQTSPDHRMENITFYVEDLLVEKAFGTVLVGLCFVTFDVPLVGKT